MRIGKISSKQVFVQESQFWSFLRQVCYMSDIFHGTKCLTIIPVANYSDSLTILSQHPNIKRNIVPDDVIRFIYTFQKRVDITFDISIRLQHIFTDSMDSLREEIYSGRDIHILIDSRFFDKIFSIKMTIYGSKLKNLIRRRKSGSFRIDKHQRYSLFFLGHTTKLKYKMIICIQYPTINQ